MSFNTITHPLTRIKYSIFSNKGRNLLKSYLKIYKSGGSEVKDSKLKLHDAVKNGNINTVIQLLKTDEKIIKELNLDNNNTPLHLAANLGQTAIVELLIQAGADVNAQNKQGQTPLDLATQKKHTEIINLLAPIVQENVTIGVGTPQGTGVKTTTDDQDATIVDTQVPQEEEEYDDDFEDEGATQVPQEEEEYDDDFEDEGATKAAVKTAAAEAEAAAKAAAPAADPTPAKANQTRKANQVAFGRTTNRFSPVTGFGGGA